MRIQISKSASRKRNVIEELDIQFRIYVRCLGQYVGHTAQLTIMSTHLAYMHKLIRGEALSFSSYVISQAMANSIYWLFALVMSGLALETATFIPIQRSIYMPNTRRQAWLCPVVSLRGSMTHISSVSNPLVKRLVRLRENSRFRKEEGSVLLVGSAPIQEVLQSESGQPTLKSLILLEDDGAAWHNEYTSRFPISGADVYTVPGPVMKKISGLESSERHIAVAEVSMPEPVRVFFLLVFTLLI
jgi:hypothetical protein